MNFILVFFSLVSFRSLHAMDVPPAGEEQTQKDPLALFVPDPELLRSEALQLAESYCNIAIKSVHEQQRDKLIGEYKARKDILENKLALEDKQCEELDLIVCNYKRICENKKQSKDQKDSNEKNALKDYYAQQPLAQWSADKVRIWLEGVVPGIEEYNLYIAGSDLFELTREEISFLPVGKKAKVYSEISKLIEHDYKNRLEERSSNYCQINSPPADLIIVPEQIFADFKDFLTLYCRKKGYAQQSAEDFYAEQELFVWNAYKALPKKSEALSDNSEERRYNKCICLKLWSSMKVLSNNKLEFSMMTSEILRSDDKELLQSLSPIIKGIIDSLNYNFKHWPADLLLYRGSGIGESQIPLMIEGKIFRFKTFFSTSKNKKVAEIFLNRVGQFKGVGGEKLLKVLYIIELPDPAGISKACNLVGRMGKYETQGESEFLFPPCTAFKVKKVEILEDQNSTVNIWLEAQVSGARSLPFLEYN